MKTINKYLEFLPRSFTAVTLLLLILFLATPGFSGLFSYDTPPSEQSANISEETSVSPQPDTAKPAYRSADNDEFSGFNQEIPGIGAFFNEMLDTLIGLTTSSERRFQTLAEHIPLVFDDLYKVFITL